MCENVQSAGRGLADEPDCVEQVPQSAEVYRLLQMRSDSDTVDLSQLAGGFAQPIVLTADDDQGALETDLLQGRQDRKSVLVGHAQIQGYDLWFPICKDFRDRAGVCDGFGLISASGSDTRDEFRRLEIVVDRQKPQETRAWLIRIRRQGHL